MSERLKGTKDKGRCQETRRQSSKSGTPRLLLNYIGYSKYLKMSSGSHIEIWLQIFIFWLQPLSWLEWGRCRLWLKGFPWSPQELISRVLVVTKNWQKGIFAALDVHQATLHCIQDPIFHHFWGHSVSASLLLEVEIDLKFPHLDSI